MIFLCHKQYKSQRCFSWTWKEYYMGKLNPWMLQALSAVGLYNRVCISAMVIWYEPRNCYVFIGLPLIITPSTTSNLVVEWSKCELQYLFNRPHLHIIPSGQICSKNSLVILYTSKARIAHFPFSNNVRGLVALYRVGLIPVLWQASLP